MSTPGLSEKASLVQPADEKAVPPHLRCNSCSKPLFNAFQTPHGCRICQSCVSNKLHPTERRLCPGTTEACKDEEEEIRICQSSCVPDIATRREISKLSVLCPNRKDGCKEQMKWRDVDTHLQKCKFEVTCEQCQDSLPKRKLPVHLSDECRQRRVTCNLCQQPVVHSEMEKSHRNLDSDTCCPRYSDYCPYCKDRARKLNRSDYIDHQSVCSKNPVIAIAQMKHYLIDFKKKMQNIRSSDGDGSDSEAGAAHPTSLEATLISEIRQKVEDLEFRLQILESTNYDGFLVWKVNNLTKRRREAIDKRVVSIFSQPFFSRHFGFMFRVRLFLNGRGRGEGTHVSVYLVLMQHEFDDIQEWPLKATVSFKMVNLRNRADDVSKTVRFDSGSERPLSREDLSVCCGEAKFMSINQFENSDRFVKNDIFYLEVEVGVDGETGQGRRARRK